jgi:Coenzyme PQQ synthesis protein D (PqqD)
MVSSSSTIAVLKNQISCNLGTETIILEPKTSSYYGLNDVATLVWNLIQTPKTVKEIQDAIVKTYEVEQEECQRDLWELIENLQSLSLIEVQ